MTTELKRIECPCGFTVQGHDANEVVRLVKTHAREAHNEELAETDLRQMMKTVQATPQ